MPEVILPCPNPKCGSKFVMTDTSPSGADIVKCCTCFIHGPYSDTEESAIAAWNALPRMSTIIAWQLQAAGAALALQRLMDAAQAMREAQQAWEKLIGIDDDMRIQAACKLGYVEDAFDVLLAKSRKTLNFVK